MPKLGAKLQIPCISFFKECPVVVLKLLTIIVPTYFFYVIVVMIYFELKTRGDNYFALPLTQRWRMIERLKRHARYIRPAFEWVMKIYRPKAPLMVRY